MDNEFAYLAQLNDKQREVCISPDNYVLTACPGSGKTRTVTFRLAYLQEKNRTSRLLNIAITYTNRAADEIYTRLENMGVDLSSIWTGTIHQFCMKFIIRPYAMYSDRLRTGYRIIDEYVTKKYCEEIAAELNIKLGYDNPLSIPAIKHEYNNRLAKNKEIDFNLILEIADSLLSECPFIAENLACIIRSLHIDEFQDTNDLQYSILARIVQKNTRINVMFVGDINQAIYGNLGGVAKTAEILSEQFSISLKQDQLSGCYRSTRRIVDYYSHFEVAKTKVFSISSHKDVAGIISYDTITNKKDLHKKIARIIEFHLSRGVDSKDICVVAPQWYQIYPIAKELRKELPTTIFDAPDIMPFKYDPMNPFYLFARLLFTPAGENVKTRKRISSEILDILDREFRLKIPNDYDNYCLLKAVNSAPRNAQSGLVFYQNAIDSIFKTLHVSLREERQLFDAYAAFIEKAEQRIHKYNLPTSIDDFVSFFRERNGVVINTIHGIKGEEFEVVIGFDLLNGHLPHWDYIYNNDKVPLRKRETKKLLYVLCSRAKTYLYLFSETGRTTAKGYPLNATDELCSVAFKYNSI